MSRWVLAVLVLLVMVGGAGAVDTWQSDSGIVSDLSATGGWLKPNVFQKDGIWYLISGNYSGMFPGFNWTGSAWQSDSGIVSGLGDVGNCAAPMVFQMDGTWYLISGINTGRFSGFNWTGSAWQSDSGIASGLGDLGWVTSPTVFQRDSTWYLIAGNNIYPDGMFSGFNWTGSAWQSDSGIISGLGSVGLHAAPTVFQMDGAWYLIAGNEAGEFSGYVGTPSVGTPTNLTYTKGKFWVNHTWDAGSGINKTDSYNVSVNDVWYNDTTNEYYNNTLTTYGNWSNITVYGFNNTEGISSGSVSEDVQLPYLIPAVPIGTGSTWDLFWVNHTWTEGSSYGIWCGDTDSYNVSVNDVWYNDTTNEYYNNTLTAYGDWSNITVYAFNNTGGMNQTYIYQNVQIPYFTPSAPTGLGSTQDFFWVNHTWMNGTGGNITDSYNVSVNDVWHNGTTNKYYNDTLNECGDWSNITVYAFNNSGVINETSVSQNVQIPCFIPPTPTGLGSTWDCFWVNHTWTNGTGHVTDSYNVSVNDVWHNGTTNEYYIDTLSDDGDWSNITIYAFNNSGAISETSVSQNVQISCFVPPTPVNLQHTAYRTHVDFTWDAGSGYTTDSYNVSENDVWNNGTDNTSTITFGAYGYGTANITVYAYNNTSKLISTSAISDSVTVSPPTYPITGTLTTSMSSCSSWSSYPEVSANVQYPDYIQYSADITWDAGCEYCGSTQYKVYRKSSTCTLADPLYCPTTQFQKGETYVGYCVGWGNPLYLIIKHYGGCPITPSTITLHYIAYKHKFVAAGELSCVDRVELKYYSRSDDEYVLIAYQDGGTEYSFTIAKDLYYKISFDGDEYDFYCEGPYYLDYYACGGAWDWKVVSIMNEEEYPIQNFFYAIYDHDEGTWTPKWTFTNDNYVLAGGLSPDDHNVTIYIRTFDGVYSYNTVAPGYGTLENITYTNFTIPIKYNLNVITKEHDDMPLFFAVSGVSDVDKTWTQWGLDLKGGPVTIRGVWGGPTWIYCSRVGFQDYESFIMWDEASALTKDYRHEVYIEESVP